jgi:hypothetical protein
MALPPLTTQAPPATNPKIGFWMNYDLGLQGDYKGLFGWLDTMGARECASTLAYFERELPTSGDAEEVANEIVAELRDKIRLKDTDRVYLIGAGGQPEKRLITGRFIVGGRRTKAPWEGYGIQQEVPADTPAVV